MKPIILALLLGFVASGAAQAQTAIQRRYYEGNIPPTVASNSANPGTAWLSTLPATTGAVWEIYATFNNGVFVPPWSSPVKIQEERGIPGLPKLPNDPTPPIAAPPFIGRAINLSTRGFVGIGEQAMILGIVVAGGSKSFLFRAIGPGLSQFGLSGFLRDPKIDLRDSAGKLIATNNDWSFLLVADAQRVGAFGIPPLSKDAALKIALPVGNYTLTISSADGSSGIAIAEAYELP